MKKKIENQEDYSSITIGSFIIRYIKEHNIFFITDDKKVFIEFSATKRNIEFKSKKINIKVVKIISENINNLLNLKTLKTNAKSNTSGRNGDEHLVSA